MEKRTEYRLKLAGNYLYFKEHGDGTEILSLSYYEGEGRPAIFNTMWKAISVIADNFYFHHGIQGTPITNKTPAKERFELIEIEKVTITEEIEKVEIPYDRLPTNKEVGEFYKTKYRNRGFEFDIESGKLSEDGYDLIEPYRLMTMGKITKEEYHG